MQSIPETMGPAPGTGPAVLVADGDGSGRIATLLAEAGISVFVACGAAEAAAAIARSRYDLAIVGAALMREPAGGDGLLAAIRAVQPSLQVFPLEDVPLAAREPRRFVGRVRERLLCGGPWQGDDGEAEVLIASAKLSCLHTRRETARREGAGDLADDLTAAIAEAVSQRDSLLEAHGRAAALAATHRRFHP